jgi:hypothetical protein
MMLLDAMFPKASPPNVLIGGPVRTRLDSRLRHAGMTDFKSNRINATTWRELALREADRLQAQQP